MQLYLRVAGRNKLVKNGAASLGQSLRDLPPAGRVGVILVDGENMLMARRASTGAWRFQSVERAGENGVANRWSRRGDFDLAAATALLSAYARRDPGWRAMVEWKRGLFGQSPLVLIPATFIACTLLALLVAGLAGELKGWSWRYAPNLVVGIALVSCIGVYTELFFGRLRPRIARRVGGWFGLRIVEAQHLGLFTRPGMWESADGRIVSEIKVAVIDLIVLCGGYMLPIAMFGVTLIFAARPIMA
jgi:hypothetical protein